MKLPHPAALQTQAEALFSPLLSALEQREDLALASLHPPAPLFLWWIW